MRALLLALLLCAPLAVADHVASHRYILDGRLLGADGLPLAGRAVTVATEGARFAEPCAEPQRDVTDAHGDFRFCYHVHALGNGVTLVVRAGNATARLPLDAWLRRDTVLLRDEGAAGVAPQGWATEYRVTGRVWQPGAAVQEGVDVPGVALAGVPVNLTLTTPEGGGTQIPLVTDAFGDYTADVRLVNDATSANVTVGVASSGMARAFALDPASHLTRADLVLDAGPAIPMRAPGSDAPRASAPLVVGVVLVLLGAAGWARRRSP